jgi:hypothetical protein
MPINIPMMGGRLMGVDAVDADDPNHTAFVPPHLLEQQRVRPSTVVCAKLCVLCG